MLPSELMPAFKQSLLAGHYNLLLGSGTSIGSTNGKGRKLESSEALRARLCKVKGVKPETSLTRVYGLLTADEIASEVTQAFGGCVSSVEIRPLTAFIWSRLFTFNIDDVVEHAYEHSRGAKQRILPLNFDELLNLTFDRDQLPLVHLHGSTRKPESGYVFSTSEYARQMSRINAWMNVLSHLLATEPFIIAGTSLNEIDLEYYLSHRSRSTPRKDRGPSLLIEPFPDAATRADCGKYDLTLLEGSFSDFLAWLKTEVPAAPSVAELTVPPTVALFEQPLDQRDLLRFFSDCELVVQRRLDTPSLPSGFLYGAEPSWTEMWQHLDIPREAGSALLDRAVGERPAGKVPLLLVSGAPGTGKSTILKRLAIGLVERGHPSYYMKALGRLDVEAARRVLARAKKKSFLFVDSLGDHIEQIGSLINDPDLVTKLVVIGAERDYRQAHLRLFASVDSPDVTNPAILRSEEILQLIESYRRFGLLGNRAMALNPDQQAKTLEADPAAVAVCRILNDFRPLRRIVESIWEAEDSDHRFMYLNAALAAFCYQGGVRYTVLQAIAPAGFSLRDMVGANRALPLIFNPRDENFVVPTNVTIAQLVLEHAAHSNLDQMSDTFCALARGLAPYVSRLGIMRRSPDARLARRLLDADKIVKPLLGSLSATFYTSVHAEWEWNSRYWEQRALLTAETDLETAIQYARHALTIEVHPFTMTTLGNLILRKAASAATNKQELFGEAFDLLREAISTEADKSRVVAVQPYFALLRGAKKYLESGGTLSLVQFEYLNKHISQARIQLAEDPNVQEAANALSKVLASRSNTIQ